MEENKRKLLKDLSKETNDVTYYLETDKNVYIVETEVDKCFKIFIKPIINILNKMNLVEYDVSYEVKDSFSILNDDLKKERLLDIKEKLNNAKKPDENIYKNKEKLKYFYIKIEDKVFIYRYTSKAYIKSQKYVGIKTKKLELKDEEEDRITLDKNLPDIIYFLETKTTYIINSRQAEYIIDLDSHLEKISKEFPKIQEENELFTKNTFEYFQESLKDTGKSKIRKFVKMIENKTYVKFLENKDKALKIKEKFSLEIEFDKNNNIIFTENTSIEDILHLLADDYVQSYLDGEDKVIN